MSGADPTNPAPRQPSAHSGDGAPDSADRAVERTESEERIFEAALRVFARKGRDGARMQEIADEAQINKAMLHYYFRSKDKLYSKIFGFVFRRFERAFFDAVEKAGEASFDAALEAFVDHYIDFIGHNTDILRLMVNEFMSGGDAIRREVQGQMTTGKAPPQRMAALIAQAVERGEIVAIDPRHFLVTLVSSCLFPFVAFPMVSTLIPEAVTDYEAFLDDRKRNILAVLRRGIEPRAD